MCVCACVCVCAEGPPNLPFAILSCSTTVPHLLAVLVAVNSTKCFRIVTLGQTLQFSAARDLCRAGPGRNPDIASIASVGEQSEQGRAGQGGVGQGRAG